MSLIRPSILGIVAGVITVIVVFNLIPTNDSDMDRWNRSGFIVRTDNRTGCEYLCSFLGSCIQRFKPDGTQVCQKGK